MTVAIHTPPGREYTGVAIFEGQLVLICRDRSCKVDGDTAYDITKRDHVECHAIGGVNEGWQFQSL